MSKRNKGRRTMLSLIRESVVDKKYAIGMYLEEEGSKETAFISTTTDSREDVREAFKNFEGIWDQAGMRFTYHKGGDKMVGTTKEGLTLCVEVFTRYGGGWR